MKFTLLLIYCCTVQLLFSQFSAYAERSSFQIGEQIKITYELKGNDYFFYESFVPYKKTIPCILKSNLESAESNQLEIIERFKTSKNISKKKWKGSYLITSWDTGNIIIPSVQIVFKGKKITSNALSIRIGSPIVSDDKKMYDIKEEFTPLPSSFILFIEKYGLIILTVLILISLIIWYFIKKKPKQSISESTPSLSLKEKTLLEIDCVYKAYNQENQKEYYVTLSFLIRNYLGKRYALSLIDKTSFQIHHILLKNNLYSGLILDIDQILSHSDIVKFAKGSSNEESLKNVTMLSKKVVTETSPIYE